MIRSFYNTAQAFHALAKQHEAISNNLANIGTSGFRKAQFGLVEFDEVASPFTIGLGPDIQAKNIDFSSGAVKHTGRTLDIAIAGDGFLQFQDNGRTLFSRNGQLLRDPESGTIVNHFGMELQGDTGAIQVPPEVAESSIQIAADGSVVAEGRRIGQISLVSFENNRTLIPVGQTYFRESSESVQTATEASIQQHSYELSNVNPVDELIKLITGMRQYESLQKATTALSESLQEHIRS